MNRKIRVALICTSLNQMGGSNNHFKNMYLNLNSETFKISIILSTSLEKEHKKFMIQAGVKEEDIILIPRFKKRLILPFIMDLRKSLKTRNIDIVHTFQIQSDIFGSIAARMAGIKCVISQHESKVIVEVLPLFKEIFYRLFNTCIRDFFRKTVAVSEGLKKELIAERLRPEGKIEIIPLGINIPSRYKDYEFSFAGLRKKRPVIGTIGRLNKEKRIEHFINAMPFVLEKMPQARFRIIGKGDEKEKLRRQVSRMNLDSVVEFKEVPWSEPIYNAFMNLDIFVMPSLREGCPTALLEALAFARPVVASDIEGIKDIVEDGKDGFMTDTSNSQLFAEKILYLCENPDEAIAMGERGRRKIFDNFTIEAEMSRYRKLYQEVLSNNQEKGQK